MKRASFTSFILHQNLVFGLVILLSIFASMQSYRAPKQAVDPGGPLYNHYNNYTIYKQSFFHLIQGDDLYVKYPDEHWDLYKYTPSFSALFGSLAFLPDWLGLNLWNLINALVLLLAIYYLPRQSLREKSIIAYIVLIELLTSLQNEQSNALIAGLIVLAFGLLERKHYLFATAALVFSVFIKLFGLVGFALFLFYPEKRKFILYSAGWFLVFSALPLTFISFEQYMLQLASFGQMLQEDHQGFAGISVMSWLHSWFGLNLPKNAVVLAGALLFALPLLRIKSYSNFRFRTLLLSSVLLWVVIFNHKAESPTFVIAMTGVAIWFIVNRQNKFGLVLLFLAIMFTSLSPGDIFPQSIRQNLMIPFVVKAVPCIFIWLYLVYQLLSEKFAKEAENT